MVLQSLESDYFDVLVLIKTASSSSKNIILAGFLCKWNRETKKLLQLRPALPASRNRACDPARRSA
ncbi:hypothetical protein SAMN06266956_6241 [Paraburkholderia hospita]|nr:hypothetical protein SAMN06266956_6241 [Paraburkholderia hospita]